MRRGAVEVRGKAKDDGPRAFPGRPARAGEMAWLRDIDCASAGNVWSGDGRSSGGITADRQETLLVYDGARGAVDRTPAPLLQALCRWHIPLVPVRPLVIARRGAAAEAVENSLAACRNSLSHVRASFTHVRRQC